MTTGVGRVGTRQDPTLDLPVELIVSCALKTRHAYDPRLTASAGAGGAGPTGTATTERDKRRAEFIARVREELRRHREPGGGTGVADADAEAAGLGTPALEALASHAPGPLPQGSEAGPSTVLVRGADGADGSARYHPVLIVWHKVLDSRGHHCPTADSRSPSAASGDPVLPSPGVITSGFDAPSPRSARLTLGTGLRLASREADFLRLVHTYRLLQQAGMAAEPSLVGIIGTDCVPRDWQSAGPPQATQGSGTGAAPASTGTGAGPGEGPSPAADGSAFIAWVDVSAPLVRTFSRSGPLGWRRRSLLERYEHERAFRVLLARSAGQEPQTPTLEPVAVAECPTCPWQTPCWSRVGTDDLSRRLGAGRLDVREVRALRGHGVRTLEQLARVDLDATTDWYLPEVTHREDGERRLRNAVRRARMLVEGRLVERDTTGPIDVRSATLQIDLDVESSPQGAVYLWGFRVVEDGQPPRYVEFSRFAELSAEEERALARRALGWLREQVEGAESATVYHYSGYEPSVIRALAAGQDDPVLAWAKRYAQTGFVDLYEIVRQHFFGASGLGLKHVAPCAGFRWRDPDPGGLNSQRWFTTAVHAHDRAERAAAARRVLEYNEDDVAATAALRAWLQQLT